MIDVAILEDQIKKDQYHNCYIFCGYDEELIKEKVNIIVSKNIDKNFIDLNYVKFDGNKLENFDIVINASETLPFMSEKKVVLVYRASFLEDGEETVKKSIYNSFVAYVKNVPSSSILIFYYVFKDKREKPSKKLNKLDKISCVVKIDKIYGRNLESKVKEFFEKRGRNIGNAELKLFCLNLPSDLGIVENEIEKLCCYAMDREITKDDILELYPKKKENDIFDLVDYMGDKKLKETIDVVNELMFKGQEEVYILYMIERQLKLLYKIKQSIENGKNRSILGTELKLPPFIVDKLVLQSKKFTTRQLKEAIKICLNSEQLIKSSTINKRTELELLIINTITLK